MADQADRAHELEEMHRDAALRARQQRIAESFGTTNALNSGICGDCDEPIEPARLTALRGNTYRCASCAREYEERARHG